MEARLTCPHNLSQRVAVLVKLWIGAVSELGVGRGRPLGEFLDGRTLKAATRKYRQPVLLEGSTAGIKCTVAVGRRGKVEVRFSGLPECLLGTKPYLAFPAASRIHGITWASGPRPGIVQVEEEVASTGELRCWVACSSLRANDLPRFFSRIRILSEEGGSQPACSIGVAVNRYPS